MFNSRKISIYNHLHSSGAGTTPGRSQDLYVSFQYAVRYLFMNEKFNSSSLELIWSLSIFIEINNFECSFLTAKIVLA